MSDAAIGRMALILSVSTGALKAGLVQAGGMIRGAATSFASVGKTAASGAMTAAGVGAVAAVATGTLAAIGAVRNAIEDIHDIAEGGRMADAFGMDRGTFSELAGAIKAVTEGGGGLREFQESILTLNKLTADAVNGTEQASAAFKGLGLDAKAFTQLPVEQQLDTMFNSLAKVSSETERLRYAAMAFGEDGQKNILPLIGKTSEEIRKLGSATALSTEKIGRAMAADAALKQADQAWKAASYSLSVALAPAITTIANLMTLAGEKVTHFGWLFEKVGNVAYNSMSLAQLAVNDMVKALDFGTVNLDKFGLKAQIAFDVVAFAAGNMVTSLFQLFAKLSEKLANVLRGFGTAIQLIGNNSFLRSMFGGAAGNGIDGASSALFNAANQVTGYGKMLESSANVAGQQTQNFIRSLTRGVGGLLDFLVNGKTPPGMTAPKPGEKPGAKGGAAASVSKGLAFGSSEELAARVKAMNGAVNPQVAEQKKTNSILKDIRNQMVNRETSPYQLKAG